MLSLKNLDIIKNLNPHSLVLYRVGVFYRAYFDDAALINFLFGFRLMWVRKDVLMAGFPIALLKKVIKRLNKEKINYILILKTDNYTVEDDVSFGVENCYSEFLAKGRDAIECREIQDCKFDKGFY